VARNKKYREEAMHFTRTVGVMNPLWDKLRLLDPVKDLKGLIK
jgi:hypothetical protein